MSTQLALKTCLSLRVLRSIEGHVSKCLNDFAPSLKWSHLWFGRQNGSLRYTETIHAMLHVTKPRVHKKRGNFYTGMPSTGNTLMLHLVSFASKINGLYLHTFFLYKLHCHFQPAFIQTYFITAQFNHKTDQICTSQGLLPWQQSRTWSVTVIVWS